MPEHPLTPIVKYTPTVEYGIQASDTNQYIVNYPVATFDRVKISRLDIVYKICGRLIIALLYLAMAICYGIAIGLLISILNS